MRRGLLSTSTRARISSMQRAVKVRGGRGRADGRPVNDTAAAAIVRVTFGSAPHDVASTPRPAGTAPGRCGLAVSVLAVIQRLGGVQLPR